MNGEKLIERKISSKEMYNGVLLHVFSDTVRLPDGSEATREYIRHLGAVCIVPVTDDGKIVMERQYRYPVGRVVLEIPAGKLDSAQEDPLEAAKRELREETGITADEWIEMGHYMPAPAYANEFITVFMAKKLHYGERHLDDEEFIEVMEMPLDDLVEDVMNDRISDGKTQTAILKAALMLGRFQS